MVDIEDFPVALAETDAIEPMMGAGLITLERVQVLRYGTEAPAA